VISRVSSWSRTCLMMLVLSPTRLPALGRGISANVRWREKEIARCASLHHLVQVGQWGVMEAG
jgi:hypothetical protein